MFNNISEKVIEYILVADKSILSEILSVKASDLSFLARQKILESGKLDLLYLYNNSLLLIELKVVPFYKDIISQINNYFNDLTELQKQNKLIKSSLQRIIVVTKSKSTNYNLCKENDIKLISYKQEDVLLKYYENFKELSQFLKIQSGDYGMVRL